MRAVFHTHATHAHTNTTDSVRLTCHPFYVTGMLAENAGRAQAKPVHIVSASEKETFGVRAPQTRVDETRTHIPDPDSENSNGRQNVKCKHKYATLTLCLCVFIVKYLL